MSTARLATVRTGRGTRAVRLEGEDPSTPGATVVETGHADVGALLADPAWRERVTGDDLAAVRHRVADLDLAPVVPAPEKIVCVGLNYRAHILEMGRELPEHPTLFAKYARALVGARDDVLLPAASSAMDWEAELAVVVGAPVRQADRATAERAIAGYTVLNDVTARDWQNRTAQWLQGKTFEATTPVGPWLVTTGDDGAPPEIGELSCSVDGETVQKAHPDDLVFDPVALVAYVSQIVTLVPGDLIATGTPGGVGYARRPPRYLRDGAELVTRIEGLGELRNTCRSDRSDGSDRVERGAGGGR